MYNIGDMVIISNVGKIYRNYTSWFSKYYNNTGTILSYGYTYINKYIGSNEVVGTVMAKGTHIDRPEIDGMLYAIFSNNYVFLVAEDGLSFVNNGFVV